jgi:hypothetical protein
VSFPKFITRESFFLAILEGNEEKVAMIAVGGLTDFAVAFEREPPSPVPPLAQISRARLCLA